MRVLAQVAQRGCGVFILEDSKNPTGLSTEHQSVADPTQTGNWSRCSQEVPSTLNDSVFWCDYVVSLSELTYNGGFDEITSISEGREKSETSDTYTSLFLGVKKTKQTNYK